MKHILNAVLISLILALVPTARASTTWYVNGVNGNDSNDCQTAETACKTIGHAITLAASGDSIVTAAATYTENLTIGFNLNVIGSGANTTIIDGGGVKTVVAISSTSARVTLSDLSIRNGYAWSGGGIANNGILTINKCILSGNRASPPKSCKFGCSTAGGGIANYGILTIDDSTLSGNRAYMSTPTFLRSAAFGGGIANYGTVTLNNSTFFGNLALSVWVSSGWGGGISNSLGTVVINNSTFSGNGAAFGGGVFNGGTATLQNSILASSPSGGNCAGTMISNGYNLSSDATCNFSSHGDLNNHDPLLGPLQNNGGSTDTMALLPGSPAIDAGNPSGCTDGKGNLLATDQRGMPRPDKEDQAGCDMGAFESQSD